jgi:hypothetical protein
MIEKNYNRFIIAQQAGSVNGGNPWMHMMSETQPSDPAMLVHLSPFACSEDADGASVPT